MQRVILAATAESLAARGADRRQAFRTVRYLLAACRMLGQSRSGLAALLDVRIDAIRSRSTVEGPLSAEVFARLAGIGVDDVEAWRRTGALPDAVEWRDERPLYSAAALLAALMRHRS